VKANGIASASPQSTSSSDDDPYSRMIRVPSRSATSTFAMWSVFRLALTQVPRSGAMSVFAPTFAFVSARIVCAVAVIACPMSFELLPLLDLRQDLRAEELQGRQVRPCLEHELGDTDPPVFEN
jgi:hypothetical protein